MRRKVIKYLKSMEEQHYKILDIMLKKYIDGEIESILKTNNFSEIEIFPLISKKGKSMEIYCNYYNFRIIFDFQESELEYSIFLSGDSATAVENSTINELYENDFNIEHFIAKIAQKLNDDSRLNKITNINSKNKQINIFKVLKIILIILSLCAITALFLYIFLTDAVLYLSPPLFIGVIVLFIIIYKILDHFQKK